MIMKLTDNTIFITGGGSGIGRGLAEALHKLGNKVIISGRRSAQLKAVVDANPGMQSVELDVSNREDIDAVAAMLIEDYPSLNVLINNAGIMLPDNVAASHDDDVLTSQMETNLLGPIRLTSALIEHLKKQPRATIVYNTSTLAYTPLAMFAVYSATKAALHSFIMSQRFMLRGSSVTVQEIAPPWVATGLVGASDDPRAMPLDRFVEETMTALGTEAEEVLVELAQVNRNNPGPNEHKFVTELNTYLATELAG
jgi:uncharacterized oxidoreductase